MDVAPWCYMWMGWYLDGVRCSQVTRWGANNKSKLAGRECKPAFAVKWSELTGCKINAAVKSSPSLPCQCPMYERQFILEKEESPQLQCFSQMNFTLCLQNYSVLSFEGDNTTIHHCFTASHHCLLVWNQCIPRPTSSLHHHVQSFLVWLQSHLASSRSLTASRWLPVHRSSAGCIASSSPRAASLAKLFLSVLSNRQKSQNSQINIFGPLSNNSLIGYVKKAVPTI